jgi:hypothetical protein
MKCNEDLHAGTVYNSQGAVHAFFLVIDSVNMAARFVVDGGIPGTASWVIDH